MQREAIHINKVEQQRQRVQGNAFFRERTSELHPLFL